MRRTAVAVCLLLAAAARASSVSNEISSTTTKATDTNPRSGNLADSLTASFDTSETFTLNLGATLTAESQTPAAEKGAFGSPSSAVTSFSLGFDWLPTDSFTLTATGDFSPKSTQFAGTQVQVDAVGTQANALLRSQSSSADIGFELEYDTPGESDLEWSVSGGVNTTHLETDQSISKVRTGSGATATAAQIRTYCSTAGNKCTRALLAALRPQTGVTLNSQRLAAAVTAIAWRDSDFTLGADYYAYDEDPTQLGYSGVATAGRTGNGLNIAPLRWTVRPEFVHRFGPFSLKLFVQAGQYVAGMGQDTRSGGIKVQFKFTKAFKMWLSGTAERDTDESGVDTSSGIIAFGAGYRW
jgi:hypothetical protein